MENYLLVAAKIAEKQAGIREMSNEEINNLIISVAKTLEDLEQKKTEPEPKKSEGSLALLGVANGIDPKESIQEEYITCCVCGAKLQMITKAHLQHHGLTVKEYKKRFGIPKGTRLMSGKLMKQRQKSMASREIWKHKKSFRGDEEVDSQEVLQKNEIDNPSVQMTE